MRRVCNFITTIKTAAALVVAVFVLSLLSSCGNSEARYRIGFSQCVGGAWRENVNQHLTDHQTFGKMAMTNLVFPTEPNSKITMKGGRASVYNLK